MFEGADRNLAAMLPSLSQTCFCGNPGNRFTFTVVGEPGRAVTACCRMAARDKSGVESERLEVVLGPWEVD